MFSLGGFGNDSALSARRRRFLALAAGVTLAVLATAGQASSQGDAGVSAVKCAKVKVRAVPKVNAQTAPNETITSKVFNCSSARETVVLTQTIGGPDAPTSTVAKKWTITLSPGKTAVRKRSFAYACCGSYTVTDKVLTRSGRQLARAAARFTFA